ncbi:MAG: sigma 54-interacting transcriptional regulator [Myxococcota bacterium]
MQHRSTVAEEAPLERAILCQQEGHLGQALREVEAMDAGARQEACAAVVLAAVGAVEEARAAIGNGPAGRRWGALRRWASGLAATATGEAAVARAELSAAAGALAEAGDPLTAYCVALDLAEHAGEPPGPPPAGLPASLVALAAGLGAPVQDAAGQESAASACPRARLARHRSAGRRADAAGDVAAAAAEWAAVVEVLEEQALGLPPRQREAFWAHAARRALRPTRAVPPSAHRPSSQERAGRLLEILEQLTSEQDLMRLLERITDSAVELTGAERGVVLLVNEDGRLVAEPGLVRVRGMRPEDAAVRFSRSIAEAVLIDGEPIVSVDAVHDRRLSEYLSVNHLELRSVACVPIRSRGATEGVLYLDHRLRRGRFGEPELSLLRAFASQAAIALANARLLAENEQRRRALECNNRELAQAKAELEQVLSTRTAELEEARQELGRVLGSGGTDYERHGIVARSEAMRRVLAVVDRVRETKVPVVVHGESGTGKELVARAIHYAGPRAKGPFVAVNCGAIPETLLESELFGHVRGAFTGADRDRRGLLQRASGGTLFLDEVADMPPKMQVELLRVLAEGTVTRVGGDAVEEVDVRVVAATRCPLHDLVAQGRFREDLYYRIAVVEVRIPPLRERPEDIPLLCQHFLRGFVERRAAPPRRLSREALERLCAHPLPGNARHLEHLLLNASVLAEGDAIAPADLALGDSEPAGALPPVPLASSWKGPATLDQYKDDEKRRILEALQEHGWNRARAARALGMPRRTFYRRLKEHGIQ